jgi:hypothetical protein
MACTRINFDDCRVKKKLQQTTDPGRYMMNVPGNGDRPCYIEDPQIILQKWGANLRTNTIDLESSLMGINRHYSKDCLGKNNYILHTAYNQPIEYPNCKTLFTEQPRATMPAWTVRELEQPLWSYLPLNPQENTCMPFQNNLDTRILEKDAFTKKCIL